MGFQDAAKGSALDGLVQNVALKALSVREVIAILQEFSLPAEKLARLKTLLTSKLLVLSGFDVMLLLNEFQRAPDKIELLQMLVKNVALEPLSVSRVIPILQTVSLPSDKLKALR